MHEKDNKLIQEIKSGNEAPIVKIYKLFRNEFLDWGLRNFAINVEQLKDIFQDTVLDFQQNIISGQLNHLTSTLKTYLFQIGKFKIINFLKREQRITYLEEIKFIKKEKEEYMLSEERQYNLDDIAKAMAKLPEDCQSLLKLYYFKEYDMSSIARELNYKNSDTAKSKKSVCLKKLIIELNKLSKILVL
jgi:RNA polymerase sigma factor (sigma-70 family)